MELKNIKNIKVDETIKCIEKEFGGYDFTIKFWKDEEYREEGISSIYTPRTSNLQEIIHESKKLVDRDGIASVEVITSDEEETIYFYDSVEEKILSY